MKVVRLPACRPAVEMAGAQALVALALVFYPGASNANASKPAPDDTQTLEFGLGGMFGVAAACNGVMPEEARTAIERWSAEYASLGKDVRVSQQSENFKTGYAFMTRQLQGQDEETLRSDCKMLLSK